MNTHDFYEEQANSGPWQRRYAAQAFPLVWIMPSPTKLLGAYFSKPGCQAVIVLNEAVKGRKAWRTFFELLYLHYALSGWLAICQVRILCFEGERRRPRLRKTARRLKVNQHQLLPVI